MKNQIEIIYADHKVNLRKSFLESLRNCELKIVGETNDGFDVIKYCRWGIGDVLLLDLELAPINGKHLLDTVLSQFPNKKIIILSYFTTKILIENCFFRGAKGFIAKDYLEDVVNIKEGIKRVVSGKTFVLSPEEKPVRLTPRQINIISLICAGKTNVEIAQEVQITTRGVEKQRQRLYKITGSESTADFFRFIYRKGWDFLRI